MSERAGPSPGTGHRAGELRGNYAITGIAAGEDGTPREKLAMGAARPSVRAGACVLCPIPPTEQAKSGIPPTRQQAGKIAPMWNRNPITVKHLRESEAGCREAARGRSRPRSTHGPPDKSPARARGACAAPRRLRPRRAPWWIGRVVASAYQDLPQTPPETPGKAAIGARFGITGWLAWPPSGFR